MLTLIPLALLFSGASFDALKQVAILVSTPLGLVLLLMVFGLLRWMKEDRKKAGMLLLVRDEMDEMILRSRTESAEDQ
jgi:BCCT family betaine/carnitine transporter